MRIFVAGASGAIGQPLVAELVRRGHEVTGMTRSEARARYLVDMGAAVALVSAFDAAAVEQALRDARAEIVIDELTSLPKDPSEMAAAAPGAAGAVLLVAIHPSCRDLKPPPDRGRPEWRDLPLQGLPDRARTVQDNDIRHERVHPAVPHARATEGPAPHPALRASRQRQPRRQYRQGARVARRAAALQRAQDREGRRHRAAPRTAGPCPCHGGRMLIIEIFAPGCEPKHRPSSTPPVVRIDTS